MKWVYIYRGFYELGIILILKIREYIVELVDDKIMLLSKSFFLKILDIDLLDIDNTVYLEQLLFSKILYYKIK